VCVERANHVGDTTFYEYTPYLDDLSEAWWAGYAAWSTWSYDNPAWPVWCRERKERKMLTLLFAFFAKPNPQLERIGALSERYFSDDPVISLIRVRQFCELLAGGGTLWAFYRCGRDLAFCAPHRIAIRARQQGAASGSRPQCLSEGQQLQISKRPASAAVR
jgi:hypothetical protein